MPKFIVPITKDVTRTTDIEVDATNPADAVEQAILIAREHGHRMDWELDDCTGSDPYFCGDWNAVEELD